MWGPVRQTRVAATTAAAARRKQARRRCLPTGCAGTAPKPRRSPLARHALICTRISLRRDGAAVAAGAGRAAEDEGGGGLGGAATRRALSAELGLGAYQRSQEDIGWVPSAGDLRAPHALAKLILE